MRTNRIRHQFYLGDELSRKLEAGARKSGTTKSDIMAEALEAWFAREGVHQLDQLLGPRLDRFGSGLDELLKMAKSRKFEVEALMELVGVFMQHQLTLVVHQPPFDEETGRLGRDRFNRLIELVEKRLRQGSLAKRLTGSRYQ